MGRSVTDAYPSSAHARAAPLVAATNAADPDHHRSLDVLERTDLELVISGLVVAEATHLIAKRIGAHVEAAFLRGLERFAVEAPEAHEWRRIGELVDQYADLRLGGTDASVVSLAERLDARTLITFDRRHFAVVRPRHCDAFELLPE